MNLYSILMSHPTPLISHHDAHVPFGRVGEKIYTSRRRVATAAAVLLALGLAYHVIFDHNGLIAYEQKRQSATTLSKELGDLQRENDQLKGHVERLQNDPSAIEHQAREELHYARPGEVIYTMPTGPDGAKTNTPVPASH